jgi:NADPH:quinone reductase
VTARDVAMLNSRPANGTTAEPTVLGFDFAGLVEQTGPEATDFGEGDEVFGCLEPDRSPMNGTWADYVLVAPRAAVAKKPASLGYLPAAALPTDGCTALALADAAALDLSDRVLIVGASSGPGGYFVQLAVKQSRQVLALSTHEDAARLRGLGAKVLETVGAAATADPVVFHYRDRVDCLIALTSDSDEFASLTNLVRMGGRALTAGPLAAPGSPRRGVTVGQLGDVRSSLLLSRVSRLVELGQLRSSVQSVYGLAQAREALGAHAAGACGKIGLLMLNGD